jgi:hypothetical protein
MEFAYLYVHPAPKPLSLFLYSATRVAFCTRHFKIAHTHTQADPSAAPAESERKRVYSSLAQAGSST